MTPKPGRGETNDKGRNKPVGRAAAIAGGTPILGRGGSTGRKPG